MIETESMLLPIFNELADGICISDAVDHILYLNPAAERMLDVSLSKARGSLLCDLLCGHLAAPGCANCRDDCALRNPGNQEKAVTFEGHYGPKSFFEWRNFNIERTEKWKNLRVRCMKASTPWFDSWQPEKHLTIIEDVSSHVELEKQREDWRNMIAHDLRTPLTSIFGALRTIQDSLAGAGAKDCDPRMVEIGVRNCKNMMELLDLYLDVAKLNEGLTKVRFGHVGLLEIARKCVEDQAPLAQQRRVQVTLSIPKELKVLADEELLYRVIQNLLNNALKFTPEGGFVEIIGRDGPEETSLLSVRDTGPGIEPGELPLLFDRYHQAQVRRDGKIKGTGLGLAFCRQALKVMKGDITARSMVGQGSEFTIRLPQPLTPGESEAAGGAP